MATGQARRLQKNNPRPVAIRGANGQPRWHPLWDGNPRLSKDARGPVQWLDNWPGNRPYIVRFDQARFVFRDWRCPRGEIYLTEAEKAFGARHAGFVVVEPNIKLRASPNKDWGFHRWLKVIHLAPHVPWAQLGPPGTRWLPGVERIATPDFRAAAAVLARSRAYAGHEGGLHHAAAAFGIPAVVLFGGFISPAQTGYSEHRNIFTGGVPCGMRQPCAHCRTAMALITVPMVLKEVEVVLGGKLHSL